MEVAKDRHTTKAAKDHDNRAEVIKENCDFLLTDYNGDMLIGRFLLLHYLP